MFVSFIRTIIIYIVVTIALRIMGKRQIGELSPSEFVITILVSELASIPLQSTNLPLTHGVIPIFTLLSLEILTSMLFLKFRKLRKIAVGKISILIENGKINQSEMKKIRLSLDELLEEIRLKGFIDIKQVKYAILEANGELSVFPFSADSPVTRSDMKFSDETTFLPHTIISDGVFIESEAKKMNLSKKQLIRELSNHKIDNLEDVFLMQMTEKGSFLIIKKDKSI